MEFTSVVAALSALAQKTRLSVFRLLIEAGPQGLPATEIADRLAVRKNLMSTHLNVLTNAGITRSSRSGRNVFYAVDLEKTRALIGFLVRDCCRAHPDKCLTLLDEALPVTACSGARDKRQSDPPL